MDLCTSPSFVIPAHLPTQKTKEIWVYLRSSAKEECKADSDDVRYRTDNIEYDIPLDSRRRFRLTVWK